MSTMNHLVLLHIYVMRKRFHTTLISLLHLTSSPDHQHSSKYTHTTRARGSSGASSYAFFAPGSVAKHLLISSGRSERRRKQWLYIYLAAAILVWSAIERIDWWHGGRPAPRVPLLPDGRGADILLPAQQAGQPPPRRHRARHPRRRRLLRRPLAAPRDPRDAARRRRCRGGGAVVLLLPAAGAGGAGRAAQPDDAVGVLEGRGHARGRLLLLGGAGRPPRHRDEEDHGLLPRPRAVGDQDQLEDERVQGAPVRRSPRRPRRRRNRRVLVVVVYRPPPPRRTRTTTTTKRCPAAKERV